MNVFEFVIIIVLVLTVGRIIERRYAGRRRTAHPDTDGQSADDAPRLDSLEERIKVLERIVTDQGYELRQKFRDLES